MSSRYYVARFIADSGQIEERIFFVPSLQDVRREVGRMGGIIQDISERKSSWLNREYYSRDYKLSFLKSILFHLDVGTSAGQALVRTIEDESHTVKRAEMQPSLEMLARGGRFSDALALLPFADRPMVALLQAGDMAGTLRDAIGDVISLMESRATIWKMLVGTFAWIALDMATMVSTVYSMHFWAIPYLRKNQPPIDDSAKAAEYVASLDKIEAINLGLLVVTTFGSVIAVLVTLLIVFGSARIKDLIYGRMVRVPLLRSLFIDGSLADSFLLMGRMLRNGVQLIRVIDILKEFSIVHAVRAYWIDVRHHVMSGFDVRQALRCGDLLMPAEKSALQAHQSREHLVAVMEIMSKSRREQAERGAARFVRLAMAITVFYMMMVMGLAIWAVMIQDSGLSASFDGFMSGGI